jgi:hypothetical protein
MDEGLLGATDEQHVKRAIKLGRAIVTADYDFLRVSREHIEVGSGFPGTIFILPESRVGATVRAIALIATVLEPAEIANWIEWVP